jgi:flagellar biosynthesis protein FlhB
VAAAIAIALSAARFALADAIVAACRSAAEVAPLHPGDAGWLHGDPRELGGGAASGDASALAFGAVTHTVLSIAAPLLVAAALAAILAHLAQTRRLWNPRRKIERAPALEGGPAVRARGAAFDLLAVGGFGAVAFGWIWLVAPRLATLVELEPREMLGAAAALGASFIATIAIAWIAIGVLDALARQLALGTALAMTTAEKREDDRMASADPRWARQRALIGGDASMTGVALSNAVASSVVVILGDDLAIAIAWDPTRRPIPTRVAVGRRARATQLVGLARRHRVAVHRDLALARALGDGEGPVPEIRWRTLADVLAAVRRA